ncbi:hypothetical protein [Streptomyces sp. NPDC051132]|uniref:hypothetical protein n=1 Tax=unclassified Streptomyces TaxID=2593676 RepID=UPI00343EF519
MPDKPTDPNHYDKCPVNTGQGPAWDPDGCRCEAITAEREADEAGPTFAHEWGAY